jgi:hypothetical protein
MLHSAVLLSTACVPNTITNGPALIVEWRQDCHGVARRAFKVLTIVSRIAGYVAHNFHKRHWHTAVSAIRTEHSTLTGHCASEAVARFSGCHFAVPPEPTKKKLRNVRSLF